MGIATALGMMLIFTFLFSKTWKIDSGPIAYPIFVLSGLICWNLFSSSVSHAGESMIQNAHIIKKIYFPRLIIPCSAMLVALFDFLIAFIIFMVLCPVLKQPYDWTAIIYFPAGILLSLLAAAGLGFFLAALNVKFRDFRYALPFLLQVLFFASQVIYPLQSVQQSFYKYLLALNPMNAAIELFRAPLSPVSPDMRIVAIGASSALLLFVIGLFYFRKTEAYFADLA
ncbi:MAG: ABC transporter permease [Chitinophagaceae bacterium]|nr:ABC transporter permease [Chitinophagaceae bacterium]